MVIPNCGFELERAGLGHNTLSEEALALIVRSANGVLRHARNITVGSLIEAVRDATRTVAIKQVNRVLMQPHLRAADYNANTGSNQHENP